MVPNFGRKPWSLVHHVCVKSAIERIQPTQAFFYCEYEPKGPWWRLTRKLVKVVRIRAPREIFGHPLQHPAHRADVVRLEKLLEFGGIYLDCDVFVHRNFDDLLGNSAVLGEEGDGGEAGRIGLCNAVVLAEPHAPFLERWYAEYRSFRSIGWDEHWKEHSVIVPSRLAKEFPREITVVPPTAFYRPSWLGNGIQKIFASVDPVCVFGTHANHLWESFAWELYLRDLTPRRIRNSDSNFHRWVRPMIGDLPPDYGAPTISQRIRERADSVVRKLGGPVKRWARRIWPLEVGG
jgi:hypothetical protein